MQAKVRAGGLWCSVLAVLVAGSLVFAQDEKKPEGKGGAKGGAKKVQNRLPDNYGKLNLSDEQKAKIYAVQAANQPKIAELNAQLKALKDQIQAEVDAVLTPDQLKLLGDIRAEAKKKQADGKAKAPTDKKPDAAAAPEKKPDGDKKPAPDKK